MSGSKKNKNRYCNYVHRLQKISGLPSEYVSRDILPLRSIPHKEDPRRERSFQRVLDIERSRSELPLVIIDNAKSESKTEYARLLRRIVIPVKRSLPITRASDIPNCRDPRRVKICERANHPSWEIGPPNLVENEFIPVTEETCPVLVIDVSDWPKSKQSYIEIIPHECNVARSKLNICDEIPVELDNDNSLEIVEISQYHADYDRPMLDLDQPELYLLDENDELPRRRRISDDGITFVKEEIVETRPTPRLDEENVVIINLCEDEIISKIPKTEPTEILEIDAHFIKKEDTPCKAFELVSLDDDDDDVVFLDDIPCTKEKSVALSKNNIHADWQIEEDANTSQNLTISSDRSIRNSSPVNIVLAEERQIINCGDKETELIPSIDTIDVIEPRVVDSANTKNVVTIDNDLTNNDTCAIQQTNQVDAALENLSRCNCDVEKESTLDIQLGSILLNEESVISNDDFDILKKVQGCALNEISTDNNKTIQNQSETTESEKPSNDCDTHDQEAQRDRANIEDDNFKILSESYHDETINDNENIDRQIEQSRTDCNLETQDSCIKKLIQVDSSAQIDAFLNNFNSITDGHNIEKNNHLELKDNANEKQITTNDNEECRISTPDVDMREIRLSETDTLLNENLETIDNNVENQISVMVSITSKTTDSTDTQGHFAGDTNFAAHLVLYDRDIPAVRSALKLIHGTSKRKREDLPEKYLEDKLSEPKKRKEEGYYDFTLPFSENHSWSFGTYLNKKKRKLENVITTLDRRTARDIFFSFSGFTVSFLANGLKNYVSPCGCDEYYLKLMYGFPVYKLLQAIEYVRGNQAFWHNRCNFWDQYRSKRPRLNDSLESQEIILNNLILRKGDKGEELKQKIKYLFDDSDSDEIKYIENTKRVEGEKKNVSPSKKIISKTSIEVDVIKYKSTVLDVENISDSADLNHNSSKILQLPEPAVLNKNLLLPNNLESEKLSNDSITLKPKDVIESKLRNENESNAQFEDYNNTYTNLKENDKNKLNINTITKSSKKDMPLVDFDNTVSTVNINYYTENNICTEKQVNEKQNLSLNDSTKENVSSESNNDAENSLNILSSAITSNSDQVLPDSTGLDEHLEGGDFDFLGSMHNNRNDSEYDEYESDTEYNLDTAERSTDINQIVQNKNVIKNEPLENISYELDKHHLKQPLKTEPRLNKFVDDETDDNDCQIIDHFINLDAEDEQILKYKNIDKVSELTESEIVTSSRAPTSNTLNDTCIENSVENNKDNLVLMNTPTEDDPAVAPASPLSSNIECQDLITEMPCNNPITTNSSQFTGNIDEDFNNPHVLNAFNLTREIIAPDEIKIEVSTESNDLLVHKSLENIKKIIQEKNYVSELPSFAQTIDSSVSCIEKTIDNITPQLIIEVSPNVESENSYDLLKDININLVNEIDDAGKSLGNNSIKLRDINQLLENPKNSKRKELPQQDLATNLQFSRSIEIKDNNNSQNIQEHVVYDSDSIQKVITRTIQVNTSSNVLETTLMTSNVSAVSSGNEPITPTRSKQILHQPQVISSLCPTLPISQNNQILSNDISRTENLSSLTNSSNNVVYASNLFPNMFANLNDKDDKVNIFKLPVPIQLRTVVLPEPFRFKLDDTESVMIDKIVQYKNILLDKLYGSLWTIGSMTRETCIKHIMALCNKTTLTFETWELHANIIIIKKCVESFRKLTVNNSYTNICSAITISIKEFKESIPPIDVKTVLKLYALLENKKVISSEDQTSEPLIEELHQIMQRRQNKENSINLDQLQRYNQQLNAYKSICIQNKLIIMQMISR